MRMMKHFLSLLLALLPLSACQTVEPAAFVHIEGTNLVQPDGTQLFIRGTNLGNWLNPEGYMFGFTNVNSPRMINEAFCQLVGPDAAAEFWKGFKDNYITEADIAFLAAVGVNTIRLPFHYKLFTDEDYMGLAARQDGFERIDQVVEWCRACGLYLILDMHDAPGGQTGDNIDDSYGYPWLLKSEASQQQFCAIWADIAAHYRNEPVILGYELCNEPIATYFEDDPSLNAALEPLYKRAVAAIRSVDKNHIILLGGAQWNGNFTPFSDWTFDDKIMYTCHRYGGAPTADAIRSFIDFRDKTGLPMYMGEFGHNTMEWQSEFARTLEDNNIGYTFWPYKKIGRSSMVGFSAPEGWDKVVAFTQADRSSYAAQRALNPDREGAQSALNALLENIRFEHCRIDTAYIASMRLTPGLGE